MVSSVDGKITKWEHGNAYNWNSQGDRKHFDALVVKANLIVMGSTTYDVIRPKAKKGVLRIVMTSKPARYSGQEVAGQLEFTSEDPRSLVARLAKKGYKELLLVGGGGLNSTFFKAGLVDEFWLTIEPKIFGKGKMIVDDTPLDVNLQLETFKKLNLDGTLLLKYKPKKS